jgi:hypothetical protein
MRTRLWRIVIVDRPRAFWPGLAHLGLTEFVFDVRQRARSLAIDGLSEGTEIASGRGGQLAERLGWVRSRQPIRGGRCTD